MVGQALVSLAAAGRSLAPGSLGTEARLVPAAQGYGTEPSTSLLLGFKAGPYLTEPGFVLEMTAGFFCAAQLALAWVEVQWLLCPRVSSGLQETEMF